MPSLSLSLFHYFIFLYPSFRALSLSSLSLSLRVSRQNESSSIHVCCQVLGYFFPSLRFCSFFVNQLFLTSFLATGFSKQRKSATIAACSIFRSALSFPLAIPKLHLFHFAPLLFSQFPFLFGSSLFLSLSSSSLFLPTFCNL